MKYLIAFLFIFAGCSSPLKQDSKQLVFIHGSHFDGSSWSNVRSVTDVKFKGVSPTTGNRSLNETSRFYCDQITTRASLVVHSYGGAIANQMTAICSNKIAQIIYIAAVSPHNNEMSFDLLSTSDQNNYASIVNFGEKWVEPKDKKKFINVMASSKYVSNEVIVHSESVNLGGDKLSFDQSVFKKIPKNYIFTKADTIIEMASQKKFAERDGITVTRTIDSGRLPMITHSEELADTIIELVELK